MREEIKQNKSRQDRCYWHPDIESVARCHDCLKQICQNCIFSDELKNYCKNCIGSIKRRKVIKKTVHIVGTVAFLLATGTYFYAVYYGLTDKKDSLKIEESKEKLSKDPCDRRRALKLAESLYKAGSNREVVQTVDKFIKTCGEFPRLRWVSLNAYQVLSEWDKAATEATVIIESNPHDKDYWVWRGFVYEQKGDLEKAAKDYEQAMSIQPRLKRIPFNLAKIYEKLDRYCNAAAILKKYVLYYPKHDPDKTIQRRIDDLNKKGQCNL